MTPEDEHYQQNVDRSLHPVWMPTDHFPNRIVADCDSVGKLGNPSAHPALLTTTIDVLTLLHWTKYMPYFHFLQTHTSV